MLRHRGRNGRALLLLVRGRRVLRMRERVMGTETPEEITLDLPWFQVMHTYADLLDPFDEPGHTVAHQAIFESWVLNAHARGLRAVGEIRVTAQSCPARYFALGKVSVLPKAPAQASFAEGPDLLEPCPLTELPRSMCAHCKRLPLIPEEMPSNWQAQPERGCGTAFPAKYPGQCYACDTRFIPGEIIHAAGSTAGKIDYVCHACAW